MITMQFSYDNTYAHAQRPYNELHNRRFVVHFQARDGGARTLRGSASTYVQAPCYVCIHVRAFSPTEGVAVEHNSLHYPVTYSVNYCTSGWVTEAIEHHYLMKPRARKAALHKETHVCTDLCTRIINRWRFVWFLDIPVRRAASRNRGQPWSRKCNLRLSRLSIRLRHFLYPVWSMAMLMKSYVLIFYSAAFRNKLHRKYLLQLALLFCRILVAVCRHLFQTFFTRW